MPTLRAEFLGGGGGPEWPSLAQLRNNRTWEGVRAPQVCELILLSSHLCSCRARGAQEEGSASRESKNEGQVQALHCQSFPSSQGLPGSNLFLCLACFVSLLQAGAGFGGVCNLQTGAAALLQTQRRPLPCKSRRGSWRCTRRRAGPRPRPDKNPPTSWPVSPGPPQLLT